MQHSIICSQLKEIINKEFSVDIKGYSADEVDSFLDMIIEDYKMIENCKGIIITKDFDGKVLSDTFVYEGTKEDWGKLDKDKFFEDIPCIKCSDGSIVQKL